MRIAICDDEPVCLGQTVSVAEEYIKDRKDKITNKINDLIYEKDSVGLSDEKIIKLKAEVQTLKSKI